MSKPNEHILEDIRGCLYSEMSCDNKDFKFDYMCEKLKKPCTLLKEPFCEIKENFPESFNT